MVTLNSQWKVMAFVIVITHFLSLVKAFAPHSSFKNPYAFVAMKKNGDIVAWGRDNSGGNSTFVRNFPGWNATVQDMGLVRRPVFVPFVCCV